MRKARKKKDRHEDYDMTEEKEENGSPVQSQAHGCEGALLWERLERVVEVKGKWVELMSSGISSCKSSSTTQTIPHPIFFTTSLNNPFLLPHNPSVISNCSRAHDATLTATAISDSEALLILRAGPPTSTRVDSSSAPIHLQEYAHWNSYCCVRNWCLYVLSVHILMKQVLTLV